jgi:3-deoxy-D-manno-octulosonate 8-phosphate phosphatase (KDO 8-P phosphatase)
VDLPVLARCGLSITVAGAPAVVRQRAHYVTRARGGEGAVREASEMILYAQGSLSARLAAYAEK